MNFRLRQRDEISLDLTSLIDVVFLLLLFFMLTTTFVESGRLKVDLPKVEEGGGAERKNELWVIEIDAAGHYALNGEAVEADQLTARLRAVPGRSEHTQVLIRADGRTPHQAVVRALDAARGAGLMHIGLATKPTPPAR
ncbi:MAG: biopolymer transporter ExbD [Gammaproteobacteria bacterium]|nr:biopolymer transporter ExbD [Gammaproteobacteria bacterium]